MVITRRDFIKRSLIAGSFLFVTPYPLYAARKKEQAWTPAYARLEAKGEFALRIEEAYSLFAQCALCPR